MISWIQNNQRFWYWKIKAKSNIKDFLRQVKCCLLIYQIAQSDNNIFSWSTPWCVSFLKKNSQVPIRSVAEFNKLYFSGCSSGHKTTIELPRRSHRGLVVNVLSSAENSDACLVGKMNFVDLAGFPTHSQLVLFFQFIINIIRWCFAALVVRVWGCQKKKYWWDKSCWKCQN